MDELFPDVRQPKKRGPNKHSRDQRAAAAEISQEAKQLVFDYWKERHSKRVAHLDAKRDARIGWAIRHYGIQVCKDAIDGCLVSDWHMGKNPNNKKYNDINNIFCDAQHVEMFLRKLEEQTNRSARESWIDGGA